MFFDRLKSQERNTDNRDQFQQVAEEKKRAIEENINFLEFITPFKWKHVPAAPSSEQYISEELLGIDREHVAECVARFLTGKFFLGMLNERSFQATMDGAVSVKASYLRDLDSQTVTPEKEEEMKTYSQQLKDLIATEGRVNTYKSYKRCLNTGGYEV